MTDNYHPDEDRLSRTVERTLGSPLREFRSSRVNLIAGFVVAALFGAAGIAFIGFVLILTIRARGRMPLLIAEGKEISWAIVLLGVVTGGMVCVLSYCLLDYCRRYLSHRVVRHERGLAFRLARKQDLIPWADVAVIHETVLYERWPILKPPANWLLPRKKSSSYVPRRSDGAEFIFSVNSLKRLREFEQVLHEEAERWRIPWKTTTDYG